MIRLINRSSQLPIGVLERFLFVIDNPPKTIKEKRELFKKWTTFKHGEINHKILLYHYRSIFIALTGALDEIFSSKEILTPHKTIISDYSYLYQLLLAIEDNRQFQKIYHVRLDLFPTIEGDYERLSKDWEKHKGIAIDDLGNLNNLCRLKGVGKQQKPFLLYGLIAELNHNLKEHKKLQKKETNKFTVLGSPLPQNFKWDEKNKKIFHCEDYGDIKFNLIKTNNRKVFKELTDTKEEMVNIKRIAIKINTDTHYVRSVISGLNKKIKGKHLKITSTDPNCVKLVFIP